MLDVQSLSKYNLQLRSTIIRHNKLNMLIKNDHLGTTKLNQRLMDAWVYRSHIREIRLSNLLSTPDQQRMQPLTRNT